MPLGKQGLSLEQVVLHDESKGVSKVYVCEIDVIICKFGIFKRGNDYLYLFWSISLWSKSFLTRV